MSLFDLETHVISEEYIIINFPWDIVYIKLRGGDEEMTIRLLYKLSKSID